MAKLQSEVEKGSDVEEDAIVDVGFLQQFVFQPSTSMQPSMSSNAAERLSSTSSSKKRSTNTSLKFQEDVFGSSSSNQTSLLQRTFSEAHQASSNRKVGLKRSHTGGT